MTTLPLTPEQSSELAAVDGELAETVEVASQLDVRDDEGAAALVEALDAIAQRARGLATLKASILRPLSAAVDAVRDLFRPAEQRAAQAEALCKGALARYHEARQRAAEGALGALRTATTPDEREAALAAHRAAGGALPAGVSAHRKRDFEVTDPAQVPAAYLCPDEAAIALAVRAGVEAIPGVRIFETTAVRRTAKRKASK